MQPKNRPGLYLHLCAIVLLLGLLERRGVAESSSRLEAVSLGTSEDFLTADLATDGKVAHVVWQSESGLFYSTDGTPSGKWSRPERIETPSGSGSTRQRRLRIECDADGLNIFHGHRLARFRRSPQMEASWQALPPLLETPRVATRFDVSRVGDRLVIATASFTGALDIWLGSGRDRRFEHRVLVPALEEGRIDPVAEPAVLVSGRVIHVLWSRPARANGRPGGELLHFQSNDAGDSWLPGESIDTHSELVPPTQFRFLEHDGGRTILFLAAGSLYSQNQSREGGPWGKPTLLVDREVSTFESVESPRPHVLWVDDRHRERAWWGSIPFHQLFRPNDSPKGWNNDTFLAHVASDGSAPADLHRLTAFGSYTAELRALVLEETLYVARTGRSRVGQSLDEFGAKPELWVHRFRLR